MKRSALLCLLAALVIPLSSEPLHSVDLRTGTHAQAPPGASELAVTISLLGEKGDVYRPGKEIRFSFQTTKDAYVVIYNIDSEGYVNLLYPEDGHLVMSEARTAHFIPDPATDVHWETGDKTGVEYVHALAVSKPDKINEDELYFLAKNDRLSTDKRFRIDLDPFLAFNSIDEELVNGAEQEPPATDYTYFYINRQVEYPRYLCSKCHSPEKLPDPYAMECPEIIIEKVAYDEDPHYPYPPLFDVRHVGEKTKEEDYYSSGRYSENWLDDEEGDAEDYEEGLDTHVYLSFGIGSYGYPFRPYWPFYEPYFPVYYWDPFWWDFSWNYYWGSYYWWPAYGWGYSPYNYWAYHYYRYPWWGCDRDWAGCDCRYRPILAERSVEKRYVDYRRTNTDIHRTRALADSRLMRTRRASEARSLERSDIQRLALERNLGRSELGRSERSSVKSHESERRIIYGGDRVKRESNRGINRTLGNRGLERDQGTVNTRNPRSSRQGESRTTPGTRQDRSRGRESDSGRSINRGNTPERRSSDAGRTDSPRSKSSDPPARERSKSGDRSGSSVERRTTADFSVRGMHRSSSAPVVSYSAPGRSVSRGSGGAPAVSRSAPASAPSHAASRSRSR
jgi:hypothetical protein